MMSGELRIAPGSVHQERNRLQRRNIKGLAAANICTSKLVIAANHVGLCLCKACPIPFIGSTRNLRPFAPNNPSHFVLSRLTALGAGDGVGALLRGLNKKIAFFHDGLPAFQAHRVCRGVFLLRAIYSILMLTMAKRKQGSFSATKAVKANARERVGQPKPSRVIETEPKTGRERKYKPKLEQMRAEEGE